MESKTFEMVKILLKLGERQQLQWKKLAFLNLKMRSKQKMDQALFSYVGKESECKMRWLFSVDNFQYSDKGAKILQDVESKVQQARLSYTPFQNQKQRSRTRDPLKKNAISLHTHAQIHQKIKNDFRKSRQAEREETNTAVPLSLEDSSKNSEDQDSAEEQYINRIRERKIKRYQIKTRFVEAQPLKPPKPETRKKEISETQVPSKKQKCNYFQHYIDMDVEIKQFQKQTLHKTSRSLFHKKNKGNKSSNVSPNKQSFERGNLIYTNRYWEPLKAQSRQLVLQSFQQTKAASSRLNSNSTLALQPNPPVSARKKLMYFKNNDKYPGKLKFSQLISLKRLGTMTYCSSMKTMKEVKDIKENIESKISIDSKQLVSENSSSQKKLIRIANRKVFEQLLGDQHDLNTQDLDNYRAKMKMKKEGKVRFDNIS